MIKLGKYSGILRDDVFVCLSDYFTLWLDGEISRTVCYTRRHDKTKEKNIQRFLEIVENPFFEIDLFKEGSVCGWFNCSGNNLTTLKHAPKEVSGSFDCSENKLTSLEHAPKTVGGSFYCSGNARKFTEEEVRAVCNVKGTVYV